MKFMAMKNFIHNGVAINGNNIYDSNEIKFSINDIEFLKTQSKIIILVEKEEIKRDIKEKPKFEVKKEEVKIEAKSEIIKAEEEVKQVKQVEEVKQEIFVEAEETKPEIVKTNTKKTSKKRLNKTK